MADNKWKKRWRQAEKRWRQAEARNDLLTARIVELKAMNEMLERFVNRPSEAESLIKSLGEVFNPAPSGAEAQDAIRQMLAYAADGDDDVVPGGNFPDIEFDDFMDPSMRNKEAGVWTASETQPTPEPLVNGLPDPNINPADGTPRFRTGSSGPPPVGGTE